MGAAASKMGGGCSPKFLEKLGLRRAVGGSKRGKGKMKGGNWGGVLGFFLGFCFLMGLLLSFFSPFFFVEDALYL